MPYISSHSTKSHINTIILGSALATIFLICPLKSVWAMDANTLPSGEKVVGGNASFDREGKGTLSIRQNTDRLIVDWKDFNIGQKASVTFYQPDSQSIAVNRVTGKSDDPTKILGSLSANGRIVVLDRNGVIFGKSATVDVGGLIASTGSINEKAFMGGEKSMTLENFADGAVINSGKISVADAGLAAFVAPTVRNDGLIVARKGTVILGSAKEVTLDLYGDGLFEVVADKTLKGQRLQNRGKIDVEGGRVLLTAVMVDKTIKTLVNMKDVIESDTFKVVKGKIILGKKTVKENNDVIDGVVSQPDDTVPVIVTPPAPVAEEVVPEPEPAPVIVADVVVIPDAEPILAEEVAPVVIPTPHILPSDEVLADGPIPDVAGVEVMPDIVSSAPFPSLASDVVLPVPRKMSVKKGTDLMHTPFWNSVQFLTPSKSGLRRLLADSEKAFIPE